MDRALPPAGAAPPPSADSISSPRAERISRRCEAGGDWPERGARADDDNDRLGFASQPATTEISRPDAAPQGAVEEGHQGLPPPRRRGCRGVAPATALSAVHIGRTVLPLHRRRLRRAVTDCLSQPPRRVSS